MVKLTTIEGIGDVYAAKLKDAGIQTTEALLEAGKTPQARKKLAAAADVSDVLLLKWINRADLFRIKGIGEEYADLLEATGVDTVPELAQRNPANLHEALTAINQQKKLVRQMPALTQVSAWIEEARTLPRVLTY